MNSIIKASIAAAVLASTGCATILTEDVQSINVVSSSSKAFDVKVDGQIQRAPGVITVKKENKNKTIEVLDAECAQTLALNKEIEPTFFVNILSGGAFGSTTDFASEKMWRYQNDIRIECSN